MPSTTVAAADSALAQFEGALTPGRGQVMAEREAPPSGSAVVRARYRHTVCYVAPGIDVRSPGSAALWPGYRWVVAVQRSTVSQRTLDRYPRVLVAYGPRVCVPRTCAHAAACSLSAADSVAATQTARMSVNALTGPCNNTVRHTRCSASPHRRCRVRAYRHGGRWCPSTCTRAAWWNDPIARPMQ